MSTFGGGLSCGRRAAEGHAAALENVEQLLHAADTQHVQGEGAIAFISCEGYYYTGQFERLSEENGIAFAPLKNNDFSGSDWRATYNGMGRGVIRSAQAQGAKRVMLITRQKEGAGE